MTKQEIDVAGTLGEPVVRVDVDVPIEGRRRYRILAVQKRYPEQYERSRGKRAVNLVELIDADPMCRSSVILPMDNIEPADPDLFAAIMGAYLTKKNHEKEPKNQETEPEKPKKKRKEPFVRPDIAEVAAYAAEAGYTMDPQAFMDHYDACGWVVGKNKPMRDWQAAVRNWVRRNGEFGGAGSGAEAKETSFETDAFFGLALQKSYGDEI